MSSDTYPEGTVRALLPTDLVTPPTRAALTERLAPPESVPRFFDPPAWAALRAACARLIPQPARETPVDIAAVLDGWLAGGRSDGWRYAVMPPDADAFRGGMRGLDESSRILHGDAFAGLPAAAQEQVLSAVQHGSAQGAVWETLPAARFFEELLALLTEAYYSHPLAQEEIGYVGMADARGWREIGLNRREAWEPEPVSALPSPPAPLPDLWERGARADAETPVDELAGMEMRRYPATEAVDAVVIGTGAGGAPLLARLAQAGMSVVALEAGRSWDPARDFATDEHAQEGLFWRDERLSDGVDPLPFGSNNSGTGVGGGTLHYTAYTPRPHPDDFRLRSEFGVGEDWPLSYDDLAPYFDDLEQFLGVSGPDPYPWGPPRSRPYPLPPLPLNGAAQLMRRGAAALGLRTSPAPNAAASAPYFQHGVGWRAACTNRGFCQAGCSTGAKASMDVTFIPVAIRAGAEVRPECFVMRLETDRTGRVTGVVYVRDGVERRQPCHTVFLCAGAIETPRLLLLNGLANGSGQVGSNFMAHVGVQVWGRFDEFVRPYKGIPGGLISEDMHRPADADFASGYLLQSIGVMPVTYVTQMARGRRLWGQGLVEHMRGFNHVAGINMHGECLAYAHNRVELSDETDGRGLPKPRVSFTSGENEKRLAAHGERVMRGIWEAAGGRDLWTMGRYAHTLGTCRMGNDPATSVVGADGRAHDVPNLYVMDNSVYPSSLSVNPALTQMALSLRAADRFLARRRRGE